MIPTEKRIDIADRLKCVGLDRIANEVLHGTYWPAWDGGRRVRIELGLANHPKHETIAYVEALLVLCHHAASVAYPEEV